MLFHRRIQKIRCLASLKLGDRPTLANHLHLANIATLDLRDMMTEKVKSLPHLVATNSCSIVHYAIQRRFRAAFPEPSVVIFDFFS